MVVTLQLLVFEDKSYRLAIRPSKAFISQTEALFRVGKTHAY